MDNAIKMEIFEAAKAELMRHGLDTFVSGGVSVALGGSGVVVTGCPGCRKRFQTTNQLMYHLADDVLPGILRTAFAIRGSDKK
jgi:ribulose-5-phosphate 4-epimerase/fuculose-1-phosphate aldolase